MGQPIYWEMMWCLEAGRETNLKWHSCCKLLGAWIRQDSEAWFAQGLCIYKPLSCHRAIQSFQGLRGSFPETPVKIMNGKPAMLTSTWWRKVFISQTWLFIFYLHFLRWMIDFTLKGRWAGDCGVSNVKFLQSRFLFGKYIISLGKHSQFKCMQAWFLLVQDSSNCYCIPQYCNEKIWD